METPVPVRSLKLQLGPWLGLGWVIPYPYHSSVEVDAVVKHTVKYQE